MNKCQEHLKRALINICEEQVRETFDKEWERTERKNGEG